MLHTSFDEMFNISRYGSILGCFKSAKNFICQKVQTFWADSGYVGKINDKKILFSFA